MSVVLGLVAVALVAGLALTALVSQSSASAAPAAQTQNTPGTTQTTPATGNNANDTYRQQFIQNFASQLGVNADKLNSSFTAAVNATVDQAVKDGKLTQDQADKIKARAANGLNINPVGQGRGKGGPKGQGQSQRGEGALLKSAMDAASKSLNMTTADLQTELKAGKSIADVAAEKKVDVATVKQAMLSAAKTELDTQVKDGKLTQDQATKLNDAFTKRIDNLINHKGGQNPKKGNRQPGNGQNRQPQPQATPNQ